MASTEAIAAASGRNVEGVGPGVADIDLQKYIQSFVRYAAYTSKSVPVASATSDSFYLYTEYQRTSALYRKRW